MKVGETALDAHEAILLHLGVHHEPHVIGSLLLLLFQMPRPDIVSPVDLPHNFGSNHQRLQFGEGELEADDIELPAFVAAREIFLPILHGHFAVLLSSAVHDVDHSLSADIVFNVCDSKGGVGHGHFQAGLFADKNGRVKAMPEKEGLFLRLNRV